MAAPPPGADVQRRHRPTAAGLAVAGRDPSGLPFRESTRTLEDGQRLADLALTTGLDRLGERADRLARLRCGSRLEHGPAGVGGLAQRRIERDSREHRRVDLRGERVPAAGAVELLAGADEP